DAVLERMNSVLEPSRTLFLAEKGGNQTEEIIAHPSFRILSTMNPGGDFGKKELSPALRNRFTEIWVPSLMESNEDLLAIIKERARNQSELVHFAPLIIDFMKWLKSQNEIVVSLRDIVSWVDFMMHFGTKQSQLQSQSQSQSQANHKPWIQAYIEGAHLIFLDGLGIGTTMSHIHSSHLRKHAIDFLRQQLKDQLDLFDIHIDINDEELKVIETESEVCMGVFGISKKVQLHAGTGVENVKPSRPLSYCLNAPTVKRNLMKILRALSLPKAILLEGSPGVGKTSLIAALGHMVGCDVVRINLSEQTDLMDLLGCDLPQANGHGFTWCPGILLKAIQDGQWVLLDELNLASQSVLEGLNAVLDHRSCIYIPELDQEFACAPTFRVFAAQNPVIEGGGRKGLPASFLNRFSKVYLEPLQKQDLNIIAHALYPQINPDIIHSLIDWVETVHDEVMAKRTFGRNGAPWEFNLRDVFKCCDIMLNPFSGFDATLRHDKAEDARATARTYQEHDENKQEQVHALEQILDMVFVQRMRTEKDRQQMSQFLKQSFFDKMEWKTLQQSHQWPDVRITNEYVQIGQCVAMRHQQIQTSSKTHCDETDLALLFEHRKLLQYLIRCVNHKWPVLLVGPSHCGKTSCIRWLAEITHHRLHEFAMTPEIESSELLGCFEQVDILRHIRGYLMDMDNFIETLAEELVHDSEMAIVWKQWKKVFKEWYAIADDTKHESSADQLKLKDLSQTQHVQHMEHVFAALQQVIAQASKDPQQRQQSLQ
ncbi:type A von Willebrand factor domain-containing protein, partial [Reticulomyxa filosa]